MQQQQLSPVRRSGLFDQLPALPPLPISPQLSAANSEFESLMLEETEANSKCDARMALHIHGQCHGGLTPQLLADVAEHPELLKLALAALDSQVCAQLPLEYHALRLAEERLKVRYRRHAAAAIPRPQAACSKPLQKSQ